MRVFCFGFGYVARHLAVALQAHGVTLTGTARMPEKAGSGFVMDSATPLNDAGIKALQDSSHVLVSIPPEQDGMDAAFRHHSDILHAKQWIGYLSTTGVYGDYSGEWVDEGSPLLATELRSQQRIKAEQHWRGKGAEVFRLSGIYGEGRNALEQLRSGKARRIHKEGHYFSRIHVDDIVQVLLASIAAPKAGEIYNISDDEPSSAHEVIAHACGLLGQELPPLIPFDAAELSPMARSFYMANRRVSNRKIKERLGIRLLYPTYREGLASILHKEQEFDIATPSLCR